MDGTQRACSTGELANEISSRCGGTPGSVRAMHHSHSTPAGVDGGGARTPPATPKKAGKMLAVRVQMLDDTITMFQIQAKALGRVLFDQVCKQLHLLEADYFGLEYQDLAGTRYWLELQKAVSRQLGLSLVDPLLRFCVKFYTPDPGQLEEEFTRYLFCLQVKRDLAQGHLQCNDNTAALMASYIVQAECGDYVAEDYPDHTYLSSYKFVPHQDHELECRIMENHKKHAGQSPAEADLNLLETARRCELYGMKMHPAKDHEGVALNLAVAHMGIIVFQHFSKINTFSWAKIRKISFKRKRFLIKLHPEGYGYYKDLVEFFFEGRNECKNFWKKCVEHHGFFRCSVVKNVARHKTRVLSRGSSFRYSGKTQKQMVEFVRDNYVKRQTFQRSASFRHSAHSSVANVHAVSVGNSISAHPLLPLADPALAEELDRESRKASAGWAASRTTREAYRPRGTATRSPHSSITPPDSPAGTPATTSSPSPPPTTRSVSVEICTSTSRAAAAATSTLDAPASDVLVNTTTTTIAASSGQTSTVPRIIPRTRSKVTTARARPSDRYLPRSEGSLTEAARSRRLSDAPRTSSEGASDDGEADDRRSSPSPPARDVSRFDYETYTMRTPVPRPLVPRRSASCRELYDFAFDDTASKESSERRATSRGSGDVNSVHIDERKLESPVTRYDDSNRALYCTTNRNVELDIRQDIIVLNHKIYSSSYPGTVTLSQESMEDPGNYELGESQDDLSHDSYELLERSDDDASAPGGAYRYRHSFPNDKTRSGSLDSGNYVQSVTTDSDSDDALRYKSTSDVHYDIFAMDDPRDFPREKNPRRSDGTFYKTVKLSSRTSSLESKSDYYDSIGSAGCGSGKKLSKGFSSGSRTSSLDSKSDRENKPTLDKSFAESVPRSKALSPPAVMDVPKTTPVESPTYVCPSRAHDDKIGSLFEFKPAAPYRSSKTKEFSDAAFDGFLNFKETTHVHSVSLQNVETEQNIRNNRIADPELNTLPRAQRSSHKSVDSYPKLQQTTTHIWPESIHGLSTEIPDRIFERNEETKSAPVDRPATRSDSNIFSFDDDKIRELKDSDFIDGLRSDSYPYPPLPILDSIDFSLETSLNDYTAPVPTSPINGTLAIVDEPPSAPKVSDPLPIPILPPSYATHPPIERTKSDPNTACDRQRLGSNSRRHTLMHQKSIDLTPAESSDEDYVYRQIPSAPPLSKSAASRFEMPTAEFGHFDVLQRDIEGQKTKFEVPKSQFEVLGAKTQFDLINLPPKDDFDIPYILHKRHVMNGTAPRTSDIKKETVVKNESTDKHKPCRRSSQEMSPKAPKSPKSGEYKTIEKSLSATSTERQPSSFLFTQNVDLSNINPITLEVDKNDLPVHRSNSPKRDITKIDPTVLETLNLKLSRIESDSPPMTERTVTIDRTKLETKPPHKQKYDNDVVIATKPVRGNAKDKPKRTIKARTPLSKKAQAKAKGKIRITSFSSDDESLNSDDVFGSAEATPTKLEFSPPQPRKEMESILKFESERQSHLQYAMSSTEIEGSPPQPRKTETLPFDRSLEPGHSELRRISERSISIPSSEEDFRPPERQSCTEPISEATLSSALELPTVVDVNDVFIDPSPIETNIPSIVEPESTNLKSTQSPEEKICAVDKTETTTSDSMNADKLPPKTVAAEIKQSSLEKPTITSRKEFPTTRVEKTPKTKKADTKYIIPKQTVSMKSGDVKDKTTKVDSVKEAKLKSFLADSDPVLRRGQPPGLFAHARLNLSEGSGFTALQRQIAVQSPSSTRKTKSLDTAVVSVTSLPPPNAFSCKDDTVDSTEGIDDESDSEQADDIDKKVIDFDSDVIEDKDQIVPEIVSQQVSIRSDNEEIQISVSLPSDEIPGTKQTEKDEEIPKIRESPPSSSAPEDSNLERTLSTDEIEKPLKLLDSMADANLTPQKSIGPNTDKKPPKALTKDRSLEKQKSPKSKTPSGLKTSKSQESEPSKRVATKEKSKSFEKLELKRIGSKERSRSQDDNEASSAKRIEKQQMLYETAIKQTKTLKSPVKETLPPFPIVEDSVSVSDGKLEIKIDVANFTIPDDAIIITKSPKKLDKKLTKSLELNFPADPFGVDEKQVFRLGKSLDLERERKRDAESESKPEFSVEAGGDTSEETSDIESETCDEIVPTSNDELIVSEKNRAIEAVSCLLENAEHPILIDVHEPFSPDHEKVTPTKFEVKTVSSKPELPPKPIPESTDALSTRRNLSSIRLKPVPRITSEDESLTEVSEMKSLLLKKMADERSKSEDTTSWVTVECDETIGEEESSESVPLATEDKNRLGAETISNKNKLLKFSDTRSRSSDTTGSWTSGEKDVSPGNQSKDTKSGDESSASCAIVRTFGISQHIEKYESREQLEKEIESRPISTEQLVSNNTQELIVDKGPRSPLKRTSPVDDESSSGGSGNGHPLAPITTQPVASKDIPIISGVKKTLRSTKTDSKSSTDTSSLASFETAETKAAKSKYPFEQKWLSETELRGQLKITGKSSASDRSGHSSFDESEKRNGSLDKPRIQSLDKLSTESKNSIDTESSSGSLGAAARMQKTGEAPTQEASSTWRPFLIESSGSSSLEDGILPPDYDFEDKEYFLGAEAYRLKEDAEDICALDNSIGDIPAHFAYPALTSTIASIGATETLPSFNTGGFLARTLSRISERSSNSEKSSLEENSSKRSTRYDSTNDESIVSSDRPPSLSSDTPSDEKADAAGIVNGCRISGESSDALHEKQTRNTSHSSAEKSAPGSDKNSSGEKVKPPSLIGAHLQRQISDDRRTSAEMADISFDDVELIMSDGRLDRQNSDDTVVEENPDDDAAHHSLRASSSQESEDWPLPDIPVVSEKKMTGVVESPPPDEHFRPRPREDSIDEASSESCAFIIPDVLRRVPKVFCLRESFSLRSEDSGQWPSPPSSVTFDPPYVGSVETYYMRPEEACKVIVADSSLDLTPEIENETFITTERTTIDSAAEAFFVTKEESASTSSSDTAKTSSSSSDLVDAAILLDTKYSSCEDIAMEQREEHLTDARAAEKSRVRHSSNSSDSGDEEPSSIDNTTVKSTGHSLSDCSNTLNTVVFQNMSASLSTSKSFKIGQKDEDSSLFDNLSLSEWSSSTGSGHLLGGPGSPTVETIPEERTEDRTSKTFTKSTERPIKIPSSASSERRSFDTVTKSSGSRSRTSGAQRSAQRRTRAYATLRKSVSCDESPSPPPPRDVDKVADCPNFNTVPLVRSRRIHKVVEPKRSRIATATSTLDLVRTVERDARPRVVYRTPGRARKARSRRGRGDGSDDSRSRGSDTGN